ncbi:ABC transporter substrate-binding protein [Truepera radiovictrix]|uniref:Extracellular solute-binding protein family 1 n=1 Tax=Truepera radiovictrix (strain DSM 17093 / CIP 108686 / LMG 22925 / RQ-24) TaxID=649638 RepID=D7CT87_TRURR|nr:ABC transporter substrate-binding protein [Truepera radiovictrix]ADI15550.1 extracellular solute-binding protein family 1 [Truepera radiovictrix DSM 17093]WMT58821.1 ABC transporter substrate-binding protein [Truepera radiovictrix]
MSRPSRLLLACALSAATLVPTAGSAQEAPPLNPEVAGEVELWHFWGSPTRRNALRRVLAICQEALPNVRVTEVFKPWGDIWTANIAAVSAGSGMPDVIVSDRPQLPREAAEGIQQSLQALIERDGLSEDAFWPFTWQETLYEGESYGVPFETDVRVMYYNKTLFEQAGLDPEDPPATWAELEAAADALDRVADNGALERLAIDPLRGNGTPGIWVLNNGHQWVQDGRPVVDDPAVAETLEWLKGWVERYGGWRQLSQFQATVGAPPNDYFMSGKVAMIVETAGYSSILNFYRPQIALDNGESVELEWGVAPIPHNEGAESVSDSGGFALSIPTGAENVEPAWELIKCATGPEAQTSWARDTYAIPTRRDAARDPVLMADPNWASYIEAVEAVRPENRTFVPAYANWQQELDRQYERIWSGELEVEAALEEAQRLIDTTLEQNQ